jgi:hypothetical protein
MAVIRDPHATPPDSGEPPPPPDFRQTTINTHISPTGYNLDKDPLHVDGARDPGSPTAEFFGSIRNLLHRDLSFDILSILMILTILCVAFWVAQRMVNVLGTYGQKIMENRTTR